VAETTVRIIPCFEFRRTGKSMGQVYQCWWRICREIIVFTRLEYHVFYILYPFVTNLLTLPRTHKTWNVTTTTKCVGMKSVSLLMIL
jgi:hypothetical protein